jgi:hypothetical protein
VRSAVGHVEHGDVFPGDSFPKSSFNIDGAIKQRMTRWAKCVAFMVEMKKSQEKSPFGMLRFGCEKNIESSPGHWSARVSMATHG